MTMTNINNLVADFVVTFDMALASGACREGIHQFCRDYGISGYSVSLGRLIEIQANGQWTRSFLSDIIKLARKRAMQSLPKVGTYNNAVTNMTYSISDASLLDLFEQKPIIKMIWIQNALHRLFRHNAYIERDCLRSMIAKYAASSISKNNQLIADYGQNELEIRELIGDYAQDEGDFIDSLISVGKSQSDDYSNYDQMSLFWQQEYHKPIGFAWLSGGNRFEIQGDLVNDEYTIYVHRYGFGRVASLSVSVDLLHPYGISFNTYSISQDCLLRHFDELDYLHRKVMGFSLDDQVNFNADQATSELSAIVDYHCTYKNQAIFAQNGW